MNVIVARINDSGGERERRALRKSKQAMRRCNGRTAASLERPPRRAGVKSSVSSLGRYVIACEACRLRGRCELVTLWSGMNQKGVCACTDRKDAHKEMFRFPSPPHTVPLSGECVPTWRRQSSLLKLWDLLDRNSWAHGRVRDRPASPSLRQPCEPGTHFLDLDGGIRVHCLNRKLAPRLIGTTSNCEVSKVQTRCLRFVIHRSALA